jgi:hypothetical protein
MPHCPHARKKKESELDGTKKKNNQTCFEKADFERLLTLAFLDHSLTANLFECRFLVDYEYLPSPLSLTGQMRSTGSKIAEMRHRQGGG